MFANHEDIDKLFEEIDSVYGGINVLVNNAGITKDGLLMRMKDEDWASVIDTNLTAVYRSESPCGSWYDESTPRSDY